MDQTNFEHLLNQQLMTKRQCMLTLTGASFRLGGAAWHKRTAHSRDSNSYI